MHLHNKILLVHKSKFNKVSYKWHLHKKRWHFEVTPVFNCLNNNYFLGLVIAQILLTRFTCVTFLFFRILVIAGVCSWCGYSFFRYFASHACTANNNSGAWFLCAGSSAGCIGVTCSSSAFSLSFSFFSCSIVLSSSVEFWSIWLTSECLNSSLKPSINSPSFAKNCLNRS